MTNEKQASGRNDKSVTVWDEQHGKLGLWLNIVSAFATRTRKGSITIHYPGGHVRRYDGTEPGTDAEWIIKSPRAARAILFEGALGLGESYLEEYWDTPDLTALFSWAVENEHALGLEHGRLRPLRWLKRIRHMMNANTKAGSKKNISYHYDLGNRFYSAWLDPSMTYSSAIFTRHDQPLEEAQTEKYRALAKRLNIQPGHRVLEIGCGWGGFAEVAARDFGAEVVGITISKEQLAYAQERMKKAGLANQVELRFQDYRDIDERFDRIASIEMIEAVGEKFWPDYFSTLYSALKPGGMAGIQAITIEDHRFPHYRKSVDYIQRYIFPGGICPSPAEITKAAARAGLDFAGVDYFGQSYARTLSSWHHRFAEAWEQIRLMGFDERFKRMWKFYLSYCEVGFASGRTDVGHFMLHRPEG